MNSLVSSLRDDLNFGLAAFGFQLPASLPIDELASRLAHHPSRNATIVVAASSVLFYLAEKGKNPKVKDIYDAMVFCSTCLSVGYSDILARTTPGKLIATWLMTWGPALAARTLNGEVTSQFQHHTSDQFHTSGQYHTSDQSSSKDVEMVLLLQQILASLQRDKTDNTRTA